MNIRMYGRTVQVLRYAVTGGEHTDRVPTRAEADEIAQRIGGTITELDTTDVEWMDGLEVPDMPDTYAEAVKIYEMGEAAYKAKLAEPATGDMLLDLAADHEYRLSLIELGLTDTDLGGQA